MGVLRSIRARPADIDAGLDDPCGALLRRAGRGDQSAFAELYDALSPLVYGVVLKVVRDPSQTEEVAQEVFVELWRLAARFDGTKGSAKSWAATLAHRRAIDRVRSEQAARVRQDRDANQVVREHDVVYRAATDEFCVLLLGAEPGEAAAVAERIVAAAREVALPDGSHLTVSVGLAAASSTDVTVILDDADRALAEAKAAGRDRVCSSVAVG